MAQAAPQVMKVELDPEKLEVIAKTMTRFDELLNISLDVVEKLTSVTRLMLNTFDDPSTSGRRRTVDPAFFLLREVEATLRELKPEPDDEEV
jgi:hypothetical protein